jgi:hypothetical protein
MGSLGTEKENRQSDSTHQGQASEGESPMNVEASRLFDRQAITDCIFRYTRGVDRLDKDLLLSAYHEDAIDCHGSFVGSPQEFVEWLWPIHEDKISTQHYVTNHVFDFDGDIAHVETYFFSPCRWRGRSEMTVVGGRYVDRFEKREDEWRIAFRVLVREWHTSLDGLPIDRVADIGIRDRDDVSYLRPLNESWRTHLEIK